MERLRTRLDQARGEWGGRMAIIGESGIGKTRLALELAEEARQEGTRVVVVMCRGSLLRPYEPLADLVRDLLHIDDSLRGEAQRMPLSQALETLGLAQFESTFARLLRIEGSGPMPKIQTRVGASVEGALHGEEADFDSTIQDLSSQIDLGDMLRILVQSAAEPGKGILIIVDDLDEAPEVTVSALLGLLDGLEDSPILLLATMRPDAPRELQVAFGEATMGLSRFGRDTTMEMVSAILNLTWITKELGDIFLNNTGGNPFLIELLAHSLAIRDRISVRRDDDLGDIADNAPIPARREIIVDRIRQVPPDQLKTLLHAVILGDGWRVGVLGALHEQRTEAELIEDLDVLVEAGLLSRTGRARGAIYRFMHALLRDTLYETAPPERRAFLHTRAGDYYALPLKGRKQRVESAIYHYTRAGKPERAMSVLESALAEARLRGNLPGMIALYKEGLTVTAASTELAARQTQLAEELGDLFVTMGDYKQAATAYWEMDANESTPEQQGKLALSLLALNPQQAVGMLTNLAGTVPMDYPNDLRWRLEAGLTWAHALAGHTYDSVRQSRDALGILSGVAGFGSARTLLRAMLGMALYYHGDIAEAQPHLESARAGFGARGDEQGVMFVNQVLIGMPSGEITKFWLDLVLKPLVK